jgi:hypothetical protein
MFIERRDLQTSIWDGGVGIPGLNEDFYAWLLNWGVIALTSVQEATFLTENEALRMPRTTIVENIEEQDLEEERAIRDRIGFRREWIRTGAVAQTRGNEIPSRIQNFTSALYFARATFQTYLALLLRYLRGEETQRQRIRGITPYSERGATSYDEDEDEDYVFSDRDTSPSLSDNDDSMDESIRGTTPAPRFSRENTPVPPPKRTQAQFIREGSPFDRRFREESPFLREVFPVSSPSQKQRETTPFEIPKSNPSSPYNGNPPFVVSTDLSKDEEDEEEQPIAELFPDIAITISTFLHPSSQSESEDSQLLFSHLSSQRVLTRSRYRDETESQRLEHVIQYRRRGRRSSNETDEDQYVAAVQKCAVCRMNPRVIVIWPCRYVPMKENMTDG